MHIFLFIISIFTCSILAQDSLKNQNVPSQEPYNSPLDEKKVTTGSLHIIANTSNTKIYLDGIKVGVSECTLKDIPVGQHEVFFLNGDNSSIISAYTIEGVTRTIKEEPERVIFVNVMSTFSNVWCRGIRASGPSLDIGVQHKNSYYGLNFHWGFFNGDFWGYEDNNSKENGDFSGGAALQWYYTVYRYKNIFEVAPGLASGFWFFEGREYAPDTNQNSNFDYDDYEYFSEMFFTGGSLRLDAGYKRVFFSMSYTLLIGTHLSHVLVSGIRVIL